jgi:hypothetical protein
VALAQPSFLGTAAWATFKDMVAMARPLVCAVFVVVLGTIFNVGVGIYEHGKDAISNLEAQEQSFQSGELRWPGLLPACGLLLAAPLAAVFWECGQGGGVDRRGSCAVLVAAHQGRGQPGARRCSGSLPSLRVRHLYDIDQRSDGVLSCWYCDRLQRGSARQPSFLIL